MGRAKLNVILLFVASACDGTSNGNQVEDPSPPRLIRILAQPQKRTCMRCSITDLLDVRPPVACSIDNPCPVTFQVHGNAPVCQLSPGQTVGTCTDPLAAAPVGIGPPTEGNALRLVFSKPLDPSIGVPTMD